MAESVIKVKQAVVKVAESGTTSESWSTKFGRLYDAWSNLPVERRRNSFVRVSDVIYNCTNTSTSSGRFVSITTTSSKVNVVEIIIQNNSGVLRSVEIANGSFSVTDSSSSTSSSNVQLYYRP